MDVKRPKSIYKFWYNFDTVLHKFFETGTSEKNSYRSQSTPEVLRFQPIRTRDVNDSVT